MGKKKLAEEDTKYSSDGLEIISVGSIYVGGVWDKKYWSSSRGKDRYPYPVGYQALRTNKGLTYKMEIYEGPKGPIFQITSSDKLSGSGETPDIAWENFQKKCCSRVKLWHGKRFSGKVDGMEFFGFKNALVQRLLRELVATGNYACEQSLVLTNHNEASAKGHDIGCPVTQKGRDLMLYPEKKRVTGKRSRICRDMNKKSACLNTPEKFLPSQDDGPLNSPASKTSKTEPMCSPISNDKHASYHPLIVSPVLSDLGLGKLNVASVHGVPLVASDISAAQLCLSQAHREYSSMNTCIAASLVNCDSPQEEKNLHRQCTLVEGQSIQVAAADTSAKDQGLSDPFDSRASAFEDSLANLCVPDTYDSQQDNCSHKESGIPAGNHNEQRSEPVAAKMNVSEALINDSNSEETNSLISSSQRSDVDSIGEEPPKSMLAFLLPRAIPLLKYASRKKRRKNQQQKDIASELSLEKALVAGTVSAGARSVAVAPAVSNTGANDVHFGIIHYDSAVLLPENVTQVVPDSLDDQFHELKHLSPSTVKGDEVPSDFLERKLELDGTKSSVVVDSSNFHNQTKEIKSDEKVSDQLREGLEKDSILVFDSAVACTSLNPLNSDVASKDDCMDVDGGSKAIDICSFEENMVGAPVCEVRGPVCDLRKKSSAPMDAPPAECPVMVPLKERDDIPFSESIICRNIGDNILHGTDHAAVSFVALDSVQGVPSEDDKMTLVGLKDRPRRINSVLQGKIGEETLVQKESHHVFEDHPPNCSIVNGDRGLLDGSRSKVQSTEVYAPKGAIDNQSCKPITYCSDVARCSSQNDLSYVKDCPTDTREIPLPKPQNEDEVDRSMKLIGRYSHPYGISSVILAKLASDIYICVTCGRVEERTRELFMYKIATEEPSLGSPCMVGHTSMSLPVLKDDFDRQIAVDKTGLQFTPDARSLVFVDSIRTPSCRKKNLYCSCPECESYQFEENAIKIVQIKLGYVSIVLKLNTIYPVHCVLVCEPEHLVVLDESGAIYFWNMNPTWSVKSEEYVIRSCDFLPSRIVELKKVPKSACKVVGHNGYGEFSLWDVITRSVLSRFSAPPSSVLEYLPVSLLSWQSQAMQPRSKPEECAKEFVEATMLWFSNHGEAHIPCPMKGDDIALWVFICTSSESYAKPKTSLTNYHMDTGKCWRLGLLIKNTLLLGAALQPSIAAIGTSGGHGIAGTINGNVYTWELATGTKIGALPNFSGGGCISNIVSDDSTSSALAIAMDSGQLWVYLNT